LGAAQDPKNFAFKMNYEPSTLSAYLKKRGSLSRKES